MKRFQSFCLTLLGSTCLLAAQDRDFRTDINPALRYYEAMILGADSPQADRDYLLTNEWQGQNLSERFGKLVSQYDNPFKLVRQAAQASVPCDWGIDFSPGPETLLPHLARCKALVQMAKLRVLWDLQKGKDMEAADDLVGAFALARNASQDGTLISVLVQFAAQALVISSVEANYGRFSPAALQRLEQGMEAAPPGRSISSSLRSAEKDCFHGWLEKKIARWRIEHQGDEAKVMADLHALFHSMSSDTEATNDWDRSLMAIKSSGEVLDLLREEEAVYQKAADILALPPGQFEEQAGPFRTQVEQSPNPFVKLTFPAILNAGKKQFRADARLALCRAAIAYKLRGEDGLRSVRDPFGQGPLQFERFVFQGVDRGFKLSSAYKENGLPEALIFVEKEGPPFYLDGAARLGQPLSK
jgi:hypothetical protein